MDVFETRRFDLQGRDDEHLRQRLTTFQSAVQARKGTILDIHLGPRTPRNHSVASVVYLLPLARSDAPEAA